jgi:hypothetical protein
LIGFTSANERRRDQTVAVITLDQEDIQRNQRFFVKGLYFASITHSLTQEDIRRNQRFSVKGLYFAFITYSFNTHTLDQEDIRRNQRFSVKGLYFASITHLLINTSRLRIPLHLHASFHLQTLHITLQQHRNHVSRKYPLLSLPDSSFYNISDNENITRTSRFLAAPEHLN